MRTSSNSGGSTNALLENTSLFLTWEAHDADIERVAKRQTPQM
ncbi:MAG: hypothetical protein ACE5G0_03690 [Rhodothermales bacterium]